MRISLNLEVGEDLLSRPKPLPEEMIDKLDHIKIIF